MIKLIQTKDALARLNKYMFNQANMKKRVSATLVPVPATLVPVPATLVPAKLVPAKLVPATLVPATLVPATLVPATPVPATPLPVSATLVPVSATLVPVPATLAPIQKPIKSARPFTPFQKDKLFWCFYIILNGYEDYEMNHSSSFSIEKKLKIETVEKLKSVKEKLKELKLKRTELEDELVNKPMITLKGLCALCLVHNVSITYIFGRKYCEINKREQGQAEQAQVQGQAEQTQAEQVQIHKQGIIVQNDKKEDSIKWTTNELDKNNDVFIEQLRADYWLIENIQKPLNACSAYTLTELQEICKKLQIETHTQVNDKMKANAKGMLYQAILAKL